MMNIIILQELLAGASPQDAIHTKQSFHATLVELSHWKIYKYFKCAILRN